MPAKKSFDKPENDEVSSTERQSNPLDQFTSSDVTSERDIEPSTAPPPPNRGRSPKPATETIRARITSIPPEMVEAKRGKYLSETSSQSMPSARTSWPQLRAIDSLNHNNVTIGKPNIVDGKLDMEPEGEGEAEKVSTVEETTTTASTTERTVDGGEPQLHHQQFDLDANSSRIDDHVQHDNSLTSSRSSTSRPVATSSVRPVFSVKAQSTSRQGAHIATITDNQRVPTQRFTPTTPIATTTTTTSTTTTTTPATPLVPQQSLDIAHDLVVPSTTEDETMTTVTEEDLETTTSDRIVPTQINEKIADTTDINTEVPETTENSAVTATESSADATTTMAPIVERTSAASIEANQNGTTTKATMAETTLRNLAYSTKMKENQQKLDDAVSAKPEQNHLDEHGSDGEGSLATSNAPSTTTSTSSSSSSSSKPQTTPTAPTTTSSSTTKTTTTTMAAATTTSATSTIIKTAATTNSTTTRTMTMVRNEPETSSADDGQTEGVYPEQTEPTDVNAMIAAAISIVAVITLILLVAFLFVMRKRQKQLTYGQRCRPIGLDAYSLDNVSVYNSLRRKNALRASKMAFGNVGFDDPALKNNPLNIMQLATFAQKRVTINDEFKDVPVVTARIEEVPIGCEEKNR